MLGARPLAQAPMTTLTLALMLTLALSLTHTTPGRSGHNAPTVVVYGGPGAAQ